MERQWFKPLASTCKEFSKDFVIGKSHGLDANNQAFESNDEYHTDEEHKPIADTFTRADHSTEDEEYTTQVAVSHRESAHTDEGEAVAQIADEDFEEFKENLNGKHADSAIKQRTMSFHEPNEDFRAADGNYTNDRRHNERNFWKTNRGHNQGETSANQRPI